MSEETTRNTGAPQNDPNKETPDLAHELREMGQQLEAAFKAAIESERAKQLQRDLAGGANELAAQIRTALQSLQSNPKVQQASERGRQAFDQAQQSKVAHDLQETIVTGIAQLNDQLRKLVARLESQQSGSPGSTTGTQQQDQPPATGETTRLDQE